MAKKNNHKNHSKYPFKNLSLLDIKGEVWKDIPGLDGYFLVSSFGRIWALERPVISTTGQFYLIKERIRKQFLSTSFNKYTQDFTEQLSVKLRYENREYVYKINRLVYDRFVAPIKNEKKFVVHKDGDNCNNHFSNLVLMNGTELYGHGLQINRRPKTGSKRQLKSTLVWNEVNYPRPIVKYSIDGKKITEYPSVADAAKANGTGRNSIRQVANKVLKQLHGFVYRFKGEYYKGEYAASFLERTVTQYAIDGRKIRVYTSLKQASSQTDIDADAISKSARGKIKTAGTYVWRYGKESYQGQYDGRIVNAAKPILQFALDGKLVKRFESASMAGRETGFNHTTLLACAKKETTVSHGYVWRFEGDRYTGEYKNHRIGKPVSQFTPEGKFVRVYPTIESAAKASGLTSSNIQKNVIGENKTAGGFIWKYARPSEIKKLLPSPIRQSLRKTLPGKVVVQYSIEGKKIEEFISVASAAKTCNIPAYSIYQSLDKPKINIGFVWRSKGNKYKGELANNPQPSKNYLVTQYDTNGKKLRTYVSMKEAERQTGTSSSSISAVTKGKLKSSGGFIWLIGNGQSKINIKKYYESSRKHLASISKPVIKYSLQGKYLAEFPSIAGAARAEGVQVKIISAAANNKQKSALGFLWKFKKV